MRVARESLVPLAVGAVLGFAVGYFAGGGGRPSAPRGATEATPTGDRRADVARTLERDPQNPRLLTELGNLHYDRGEWDGAVAAYEKARRKAPKDVAVLSDLGAAYRNRGEFRRAVACFRKAREADPEHGPALFNWLLLEAYDRRDPEAAQPLFDEVQRRYPAIPDLERLQKQISELRAGV